MLRFGSILLVCVALLSGSARAQNPAPTPPMGWNSWTGYGLTINEADFRANTTILAGIRQFGWQYAVVDEGWYMQDPFGSTLEARKYLWNENGILIPDPARFPDSANNAGFKPLADWVHAQGLKFGIHIVRGIPRQVVKENLPVANSTFHAADAADTSSPCPWDTGNWGVADNAAGQAYYDSMLKLYADWGLDYIKVDCISDHPYRPTEIRQIAEAIRKTARPIVLSLSPGPTQLDHAAEIAKYAQMWRITDDHWDAWTSPTMRQPPNIRSDFAMNSTASPSGRLTSSPAAGPIPTCFLKAISARIPARTSPASPTTPTTSSAANSLFGPSPARRSSSAPTSPGSTTSPDPSSPTRTSWISTTNPSNRAPVFSQGIVATRHPSRSVTGTRAPADRIQNAT